MKLKFAEPDASRYENPEAPRDDLGKSEIIRLAMDSFGWKETKCLSWYKLQIAALNGNSPMELVQRKQTAKLVLFLRKMNQERLKNSARDDRFPHADTDSEE